MRRTATGPPDRIENRNSFPLCLAQRVDWDRVTGGGMHDGRFAQWRQFAKAAADGDWSGTVSPNSGLFGDLDSGR